MNSNFIKRFTPFAFILILSCEESKELADIPISTSVSKTLPVIVSNTNENTYQVLLDATVDSEIKQYADKIKEVEVQNLYISVENYIAPDEDEYYFNGTLGFSPQSESTPQATCTISPLNVTHVVNTGNFEINNCNDILGDLALMLLADNAAKVYLKGSFTKAPFQFDLVVTLKLKITANPL